MADSISFLCRTQLFSCRFCKVKKRELLLYFLVLERIVSFHETRTLTFCDLWEVVLMWTYFADMYSKPNREYLYLKLSNKIVIILKAVYTE